MRHVEPRKGFRHDVKRERSGIYRNLLTKGRELDKITYLLANNIQLPPRYRDHALHGNWEGCRECHVRPDLLLVYRYEGDDWLYLERLGSHSEIFGI